ncbi:MULTISPECIES: hypothetical protein [unclassified Pseudomonas]|uniref:hypothetical protein n=1 Tax=unclassified Pseudomonas TaxID=196821 RepID=UPI0024473717|nr:hypothetical protein [Pseudomonas sp. GD03944]MDH1262797.1 hypothetical protein [Pseudomonas sp. GD03944]
MRPDAIIRITTGDVTVQKPFTYALLLAAMLGLAACDNTPEDKLESAQESVSEAAESMGEAAEQAGEAVEQKTDEVMGTEPTTGEKIEDAADDAGDAIENAGDEVSDAAEGR